MVQPGTTAVVWVTFLSLFLVSAEYSASTPSGSFVPLLQQVVGTNAPGASGQQQPQPQQQVDNNGGGFPTQYPGNASPTGPQEQPMPVKPWGDNHPKAQNRGRRTLHPLENEEKGHFAWETVRPMVNSKREPCGLADGDGAAAHHSAVSNEAVSTSDGASSEAESESAAASEESSSKSHHRRSNESLELQTERAELEKERMELQHEREQIALEKEQLGERMAAIEAASAANNGLSGIQQGQQRREGAAAPGSIEEQMKYQLADVDFLKKRVYAVEEAERQTAQQLHKEVANVKKGTQSLHTAAKAVDQHSAQEKDILNAEKDGLAEEEKIIGTTKALSQQETALESQLSEATKRTQSVDSVVSAVAGKESDLISEEVKAKDRLENQIERNERLISLEDQYFKDVQQGAQQQKAQLAGEEDKLKNMVEEDMHHTDQKLADLESRDAHHWRKETQRETALFRGQNALLDEVKAQHQLLENQQEQISKLVMEQQNLIDRGISKPNEASKDAPPSPQGHYLTDASIVEPSEAPRKKETHEEEKREAAKEEDKHAESDDAHDFLSPELKAKHQHN